MGQTRGHDEIRRLPRHTAARNAHPDNPTTCEFGLRNDSCVFQCRTSTLDFSRRTNERQSPFGVAGQREEVRRSRGSSFQEYLLIGFLFLTMAHARNCVGIMSFQVNVNEVTDLKRYLIPECLRANHDATRQWLYRLPKYTCRDRFLTTFHCGTEASRMDGTVRWRKDHFDAHDAKSAQPRRNGFASR